MDRGTEQFFNLIRKRLYRRLHVLGRPLAELMDVPSLPASLSSGRPHMLCASDGCHIFWNCRALELWSSKDARNVPEALLLHQVIHCLFGHPFSMPVSVPRDIWSLACDISAWYILKVWTPELLPEDIRLWLDGLSGKLPNIPLYQTRYLAEWLTGEGAVESVSLDSHELWPLFCPRSVPSIKKADGAGGGNTENGLENNSPEERNLQNRRNTAQQKALWSRLEKQLTGKNAPLCPDQPEKGRRRSGTFSQRDGGIHISLALTDSRRHDYRSLLKGLAGWGEEMKLNDNEFQYASYLYGLEHYSGMPLLEPLEYEETAKIRELAIVIDTSASCSHSLTQTFLEETRNLLLEEDLFFHPFNLHILQCDKEVERDDKLTSLEDLKDYIDTLEVCGMGGTDFRPAFSHIRQLQRCREFLDLPAILFFTDGVGLYPQEPPDARTIFVFLKDHYEAIDVPDWAEILILETEETKGRET